jgi:hypothetical protein
MASNQSAGKSTANASGDSSNAPQFVSLDQLAALLQALNCPLVKEEKTPEESRTDRAIALADALAKNQKLGKAIEPQLAKDRINWLDWDVALTATITRVFEFKNYLVSNKTDPSHDRATLTGVLIEHSAYPTLVLSVRGKTGRAAFHLLQNRFASVSWTYVMSRWLKASDPANILSDLNLAYLEMSTCLTKIEKWVGGFTKDLVLALLLHQRCQPHFQAMENALFAWIVVDASKPISSKTILELKGHFETAGAAVESSLFAYLSQRPPGQLLSSQQGGPSGGNHASGKAGRTIEGKSNSWARRVLTEANPCRWC